MTRSNFTIVPNALIRSNKLDIYAKGIYIYLRSRQGTNIESWPSHATIASDLDIGISTVKRRLQVLGDMGLVSSRPAFNGNEQTSNRYVAHEATNQLSELNGSKPRVNPPSFREDYEEDSINEDKTNKHPTGENSSVMSVESKRSWGHVDHSVPPTPRQLSYIKDLATQAGRRESDEVLGFFENLESMSQLDAHLLVRHLWVGLEIGEFPY
jgi:hypothetical protein